MVDIGPASPIDSLTYEIPDGLVDEVAIGSCVLVPLGSRQAVGYVTDFEQTPSVAQTRQILARLGSPVRLTGDMLDLAKWISGEYICPLPRVVAGMLPGVMHCRVQARVSRRGTPPAASLTPAEKDLFDIIPTDGGGLSLDRLCEGRDRTSVLRAVRRLEAKGVVERQWLLIAPSGKPR